MYLRTVTDAFGPAGLAELRACADALLGRAGGVKTSFGAHLANAAARQMTRSVLRNFYAGPLPAVFAGRFGCVPALSLAITTVRLQLPDDRDSRVGWHLDLNFVSDEAPFLVAWTTLDDVGRSCPGLEVCLPKNAVSKRTLLEPWHRRAARGASMVFDDSEIGSMFGDGPCVRRSLPLAAGGAAVFDQFVLHRTEQMANPTTARRSVEFRMIDLERMPLQAQRTKGVFCRPKPAPADGIELLAKTATGPLRVVSDKEFDRPETVFGD